MYYRQLFNTAYNLAEQDGVDMSTRNAALLVDPVTGRRVMDGINQYPGRGLEMNPLNHQRPRKYSFIEHAERAAIYNAADAGIKTKGLIMVCPWACCPDCARAIVLAGIPLVVAHKQAFDKTPERWRKPIKEGMEILKAGDVVYHLWDGEVGMGTKNLFDGKYWAP